MRRLVVLSVVALATLSAAVGSAAEPTPGETELFLRNGGQTCPGDPFLATQPGSGEPGCGYIYGIPIRELTASGAPISSSPKTYLTRSVPVQVVDAGRDITGVNRVVSTAQTERRAVGQIRVDVTLTGFEGSTPVDLGTHSSTQIVNPTNSAEVDFPFTIDVPAAAHGRRLTKVEATVDVRGWHVLTGYHRLNGQSRFTLPVLVDEATQP